MKQIALYNTITALWFCFYAEAKEGDLYILSIVKLKEAVIHMIITQPTTAQIFPLSANNQYNLIEEGV
jgi:hypothetical protein